MHSQRALIRSRHPKTTFALSSTRKTKRAPCKAPRSICSDLAHNAVEHTWVNPKSQSSLSGERMRGCWESPAYFQRAWAARCQHHCHCAGSSEYNVSFVVEVAMMRKPPRTHTGVGPSASTRFESAETASARLGNCGRPPVAPLCRLRPWLCEEGAPTETPLQFS